jgi:hypothetical protein
MKQLSRTHNAPDTQDLALGVVFKGAVALEAVLDDLAELVGKSSVVKEMVHAQAGTRRLAIVCGADALLGVLDAARRYDKEQGKRSRKIRQTWTRRARPP